MNILEECRKGKLAALLDTHTDDDLLLPWVISASLERDNNAQALCRLFQRAGTFLVQAFGGKKTIIHALVETYSNSINTLRASCALPMAPVSALDGSSHSALYYALISHSDRCARIILTYCTALPRDVKHSHLTAELLAFRSGVIRCRRAVQAMLCAGRIMRRADYRWDRWLWLYLAQLTWATRTCDEQWISDHEVDAFNGYLAAERSKIHHLAEYERAREEMRKRRKVLEEGEGL